MLSLGVGIVLHNYMDLGECFSPFILVQDRLFLKNNMWRWQTNKTSARGVMGKCGGNDRF